MNNLKSISSICVLIFLSSYVEVSVYSQNFFNLGNEYMNKHQYLRADSFFLLHIKKFPDDQNAHFNHATIKLYLKDTCGFCKDMIDMCHNYYDKDACKISFSFCGKSDSIFYDKHYNKTSQTKARYMQITESYRCLNYKTIYYKDNHEIGIINFEKGDVRKIRNSNIAAICNLYSDSSKEFTFILDEKSSPSFPNDSERKKFNKIENEIKNEAIKKLNLSKVVVNSSCLIDTSGNVRDFTIDRINKEVKDIDSLKMYVFKILTNLPVMKPATFQGEKVNYRWSKIVSFWE
jgi:hypothetical protein